MKTNPALNFAFLAMLCGLNSGCASIMSGRSQELSFVSTPDGATVTVSGRVIGKTPITTTLKKEPEQSLVFSKDGYKPISMRLETRLDGWFWGNIVLGGFFGSTTDAATGAVHEYSPNQYIVTLEPAGTNQLEGKPSLSDTQKAKEFIVMGYKDIMEDLHKGKGEYLASLFSVLKIPAEQQPEALKKIRALSEAYTTIPEFADHAIELYLK